MTHSPNKKKYGGITYPSSLTAFQTITVVGNFACITLRTLEGNQHIIICHSFCLLLVFSSEKKQSVSCSAGCFSLFKSPLDLTKQFSFVVYDIHWTTFITKDLYRRFLRTVLQISWTYWMTRVFFVLFECCWCFLRLLFTNYSKCKKSIERF